MLVAINKKEEMIMSQHATKRETYYCPCCHGEVILKKGEIKYPHFAHKKTTVCQTATENESFEHVAGKLLIAKNCEIFGSEYQLEAYLPEINQRADVLIDKTLAIEFQCSSLSIEWLKERTTHYKQNGYQVFWILGQKLGQLTSLTELKKHFIYFDNDRGYVDFCLLIDKEMLVMTHYLAHNGKDMIVRRKSYSLQDYSLKELLLKQCVIASYSVLSPLKEVSRRKDRLSRRLLQSDKSLRVLQEYLYQQSYHLLYLPEVVYLPSLYHPFFKETELVVRLIIFNELKHQKKRSYVELKERIISEIPDEMLDDYANLEKYQVIDYCLSLYLHFLKELTVIEEISQNVFHVKEEEVLNNAQWKKFLKKRSERLTLPLKYDMIIK
ncbi:competence protein CoiA [Melissococcus sp. OM08-11BH]|uniref:competence protein CoiA n=1 Tax=Melissococcus sp. OM08-11BH TaxID=2293110 RepID=UPI000E52CC59|nr:competence protein CoiA family protein [Melissococcus sp. OM08-11BH]RGI30171.1 hypothetical protein DXC12_06250 [Melissococcus sp. OM08-11BH]